MIISMFFLIQMIPTIILGLCIFILKVIAIRVGDYFNLVGKNGCAGIRRMISDFITVIDLTLEIKLPSHLVTFSF